MSAATGTSTPPAAITTPTLRGAVKRGRFWIVGSVFLLIIGVGTLLFTGASGRGGDPLSATNAAPTGSKALAEVLRQQGVTVTATSTLAATRKAVTDPARTTIFLVDADNRLNAKQYRQVAALAANTVVMNPGFTALRTLAPGIAQAGRVADKPLHSDCGVPAVRRAAVVSGRGTGFRNTGAHAATSCLGSGSGVFSLIRLQNGTDRVTVVGTSDAFSNEHITERGNAALALGVLGENPTLVWYLPSVSDVAGGPASLGELTPDWVSPVLMLLVVVFLAAAFWRGRRLGPLVVENLPVVVRASETMEGRARLYQRGSARLRALDSLRIGTIARLAGVCGLPRSATLEEIAQAASEQSGLRPAEVRALLIDELPSGDRDLVRLSDGLLTLERAVRDAIRAAQPGAASSARDRGE